MATYYVATTGNDANPGTISSPWVTINHAQLIANDGDIVIVRNGTYNENVVIDCSGTAVSRITFKAENKWGAKVVNIGHGYVWRINGSYINVEDFDLTGMTGVTTVRVGIFDQGSYNIISGNYIHDIPANSGSMGGAGIDCYSTGSAGYAIVRDNVIRHTGYANANPYLVHGIYIAAPNGQYYRNLISDVGGWGVHIWGPYVNYSKVWNNTIFECPHGGILVGGDGGGIADYCEVRNNIIRNTSTDATLRAAIGTWGDVGTHNVYSNNLIYACLRNYYFTVGGPSVNDVLADPLMVNYQSDGSVVIIL